MAENNSHRYLHFLPKIVENYTTSNYVQVSLVQLVGSERELALKGFCKHTGHNYSDDI